MLSLSVLPIKKQPAPSMLLQIWITTGYFLCVAMAFAYFFPHQRTASSNFLSEYSARRSEYLEPQFRNQGLAKNFLSNERRGLPPDLAADMKNTGISHLLAVSGAQVSFVIPIITSGIIRPVGMSLTWWAKPHVVSKILGYGRAFVEIFVASFFAALFGATGSLTRVAVFRSASHARIVRKLSLAGAGACRLLPASAISRTIFLVLCAFYLGNPFSNLSFLLSATGASIAFLSSQWLKKMQNLWQKTILTTIITTASMSLLLAPIFPSNPGQSILANLIAIPVVTWLITPLSIFLLLVMPPTLEHLAVTALDLSLDIFRSIAEGLAIHSPVHGTTIAQITTSTYLALCMSVLWALEDVKSSRRILVAEP